MKRSCGARVCPGSRAFAISAPPVGSRGKAPDQGVRGQSPLLRADEFLRYETHFAVKWVANLPIRSNANTFKIGYINQVDVDSLHITTQLLIVIVWLVDSRYI